MVTSRCPVCGLVRRIGAGDQFPAHPAPAAWPVFQWCPAGDMSNVTVGSVS